MAAAAIPLLATGTLVKAGSEYAAAEQQAELSKINAGLAEFNRKNALARGEEQVEQLQTVRDQVVGSQRATLAANNIVVGTGIAEALEEDTQQAIDDDIITVRNNAMLEAWGYRTQELQFEYDRRQTLRAQPLRAAGTLLTGGSQIAMTARRI